MNYLSDDEINSLFFGRSEDAIARCAEKYGTYLQKTAADLTGDRRDGEECVNDVYLAAWNSIPPNRPASLQAYLTVLLRRAAIDRYKKSGRAKRIPGKLLSSLDELTDAVPVTESADEAYERKETARIIDGYVSSLSSRQRYIFMSRYYANRSVNEIAGRLKVSRSTVNKELTAIRDGLRKRFGEEGYNYEKP